ncbi:hypothetical protein DD577_28880 [Klebsiella pneumoniae]|nr:hypothetical protein DD577_28880 [Klebsiella pneumoniae]
MNSAESNGVVLMEREALDDIGGQARLPGRQYRSRLTIIDAGDDQYEISAMSNNIALMGE